MSNGYQFEWVDDWEIGNHYHFFGECYVDGEPTTCEGCICRGEDGEVLASLWCIDEADDEYRKVVESELAAEADYEILQRAIRAFCYS